MGLISAQTTTATTAATAATTTTTTDGSKAAREPGNRATAERDLGGEQCEWSVTIVV